MAASAANTDYIHVSGIHVQMYTYNIDFTVSMNKSLLMLHTVYITCMYIIMYLSNYPPPIHIDIVY